VRATASPCKALAGPRTNLKTNATTQKALNILLKCSKCSRNAPNMPNKNQRMPNHNNKCQHLHENAYNIKKK